MEISIFFLNPSLMIIYILETLYRGDDNWAILDFSQRHLTGHSWHCEVRGIISSGKEIHSDF